MPIVESFACDSVRGTARPALSMRDVVGRAARTRTPMFFAQLRSVQFQLSRTVPRGILVNEVLPKLRRDREYLAREHMDVTSGDGPALGPRVTPAVLEGLASVRFDVRQRPGPRIALGAVKFVFLNAADVYLHGTPERKLFARPRRDDSHGCIRLEHPAALAAWVLADQPAWTRAAVDSAIDDPTPRQVVLTRPMPVLIFYTTAVAWPDGTLRFYDDIYRYDVALDRALRAPGR